MAAVVNRGAGNSMSKDLPFEPDIVCSVPRKHRGTAAGHQLVLAWARQSVRRLAPLAAKLPQCWIRFLKGVEAWEGQACLPVMFLGVSLRKRAPPGSNAHVGRSPTSSVPVRTWHHRSDDIKKPLGSEHRILSIERILMTLSSWTYCSKKMWWLGTRRHPQGRRRQCARRCLRPPKQRTQRTR